MTAVRFAQPLRGGKFDLAIDLQGLFRSGLMTFATGAAWRVGLSTRPGRRVSFLHRRDSDARAG